MASRFFVFHASGSRALPLEDLSDARAGDGRLNPFAAPSPPGFHPSVQTPSKEQKKTLHDGVQGFEKAGRISPPRRA